MTITTEPWLSPATSNRRVQLVQIPAPVIHALADGSFENLRGDRGPGGPESGMLYTPYIRGPECQSLWAIRSAQIAAHPGDSAWITRLVVVPGIPGAVGVAGFHAPPDDREMVALNRPIGARDTPARPSKLCCRLPVTMHRSASSARQ
jgi:ribosomal-protein-alanine N-acetyltransferase